MTNKYTRWDGIKQVLATTIITQIVLLSTKRVK